MKKLCYLLFIVIFFPLFLVSGELEDADIELISFSVSETVLEIRCPPLVDNEDGTYRMGNLEVMEKDGFPSIPFVSGLIAISDKGSFSGYIESTNRYYVHLDESLHISDSYYPRERLKLDAPQILRDYRIVRFQYFPVVFDFRKERLEVTRRVRISVRKTGNVGKNEKEYTRDRISGAFYNVYKNSILNFESVERFSSDTILYVIITPDTYYDDLIPFKEWKEENGILTKLVKFSDITPNPNQYDIRNYMLDAYNNWQHPPDYFLAVGDAGVFPVMYTNGYANDNYYVALDSIDDCFPDIMGGRLTINNTFEFETVVNKIINYEKSPYMAETAWYKKAIMVGSDEYPSQAVTKRWVRDRLLDYGYAHVDSLFAENYSSSYQMTNDITNAVNEGRGFLNYRGPGWDSYWYSPYIGTIFNISNIQVLNNGRKIPIVTSCGCGVAKFDVQTCFGEQWIRNGTPTSEKGAVSFFGPTYITHTHHNNKLDMGIYKGIFQEELKTFGEATLRGKMYMYEICGMSDTTIKEMNEYLILGDPALLLRTDIPESMTVTHPSVVPIGESVLWVTVEDNQGPIADAFVCARMDTFFHVSGHTDWSGSVNLTIFPTIVDTIHISVVAQNHFHYSGFCLVNADGPWPGYCRHYIDDDTLGTSWGNGDSVVNPGEDVEIPVMLRNYGNQEASGITAYLTCEDEMVVITDSVETFGNILPGDSVLCDDDYDIQVSSSAPDLHNILFEVEIHDVNDSVWVSHFKVEISAPVLDLTEFIIDDSGQSNPNGILDPDETADMVCRLKNAGSGDAVGVSAVLRSENPYIECIDSLSDYGDIVSGGEKEGTPFVVYADSSTPTGYSAEMKLLFFSQEGYNDSIDFYIKVGVGGDFLIWDLDENHSSGPILETALISAGYTGERTENLYNYLDILGAFKAVFICLGVYPYNYVLTNNSAVDSLCAYLNRGGRMYMEGADTWYFDSPTTLHPYFHIIGLQDGSDDTYSITGINGTFTEQMSFTYSGENNWMDHLGTTGGSFAVLNNHSPYYTNGIAYDAGTYRTVGTSFEFGGLTDGTPPSTKKALADSIMRFFGILGIEEKPRSENYPRIFSLSRNYPNPFSHKTTYHYQIPLRSDETPDIKKQVKIKIYDVTGRKVKILVDGEKKPGSYSVIWDGSGDSGMDMGQGVYFTRISVEGEDRSITRKTILLH